MSSMGARVDGILDPNCNPVSRACTAETAKRKSLRPVPRLNVAKFSTNWVSPLLFVRRLPGKGGHGVFAASPVEAGEVLVVWGGTLLTGRELAELDEGLRTFCFQIEDDLFLGTLSKRRDAADYINHSCDPNAGISGQLTLVAMRPIATGEEISFDYAMTDSSPWLEFDCQCGTPDCRGAVQAEDWQDPALQARYEGYFSAYLARRIRRRTLRPQPRGAHAGADAADALGGWPTPL